MNPRAAANMPSRPESRIATGDEGPEADLDTRILAAERAVIERDERVQWRARQLVERGQRFATRTRDNLGRIAGIGAAVVAGGLILAWALPGRRERGLAHPLRALAHAPAALRRHRGADDGPGHRRRGHREVPWARLLALAWPFMPLSLRSRTSPRFAALLMSLGLPLVARATRPESDVQTAPHVDLRRYAGRWYEIARTPERRQRQGAANAMADYAVLAAGADPEDVELAVTNRCSAADGSIAAVDGIAQAVPGSHGAKLEVTFAPIWLRWLPWVWADHWILYVDDDYRSAVVGTPDQRQLWLLARAPRLEPMDYQRLLDQASAQGFDTARLALTPQSAALH
jgi:apolipoprotein D and lipocalin family protein